MSIDFQTLCALLVRDIETRHSGGLTLQWCESFVRERDERAAAIWELVLSEPGDPSGGDAPIGLV